MYRLGLNTGFAVNRYSDSDAWTDGVQEVWFDGMDEVCNPQRTTMMVSHCGSQKRQRLETSSGLPS